MASEQRGWRAHWTMGCVAWSLLLTLGLLGCKDKPADSGGGDTGGDNGRYAGLSLRDKAHRMKSEANLSNIGVALNFYHDDYLRYPEQAFHGIMYDPKAKPLLSWRVLLLPYVEENELWKQFKLDEPWDSPHNKTLIPKMPKIYAAPGTDSKEPFATHYQVIVGDASNRHRAPYRKGPLEKLNKAMLQKEGPENTILVIEAANPVVWTKPEDFEYKDGNPLPPLGVYPERIHALFGDLKVRAIKKPVDDNLLLPALSQVDGEKPSAEIFIK